jgi:hypothetical protein
MTRRCGRRSASGGEGSATALPAVRHGAVSGNNQRDIG